MLLIVLLALVFAEETKTCDKVYMETKEDKTCGDCYGGNAVSEDKKDCVTPQSLSTGCVAAGATKDNCPTGGCADYYYQEDGKCSPGKIDNCVKYESKDKCTYCKENYAVQVDKNDTSKTKCVESEGGCLEVDKDNKCIKCYGKIEDGKCKDNKPEIENCEVQLTDKTTENSKTRCITCKKDYYINIDLTKCEKVEEKVENCERYYQLPKSEKVLCNVCKKGYYVKYDKDYNKSECLENFEHCEKQENYEDKENAKKTCEQCENKYAIKDDDKGFEDATTCVATKIEYCKNIDKDGHCKQCWSGYGLTDEGECKKCKDGNAASCSLDLETSYSCKETYGNYKNYALNKENNKCEKVNNLGSIKTLSASVSMTVMLFVVLFLLF